MPTVNALRDVDPYAITICKQGANRQRIFLRKSATAEGTLVLPGRGKLLKADGDDWSVFYCVVAEPGAQEDPGMIGEEGSVDVWADEGEIRKAAHRLLKNKAYVNAMHDAMEEQGCAIVENAVALADFTVDSTDGESVTIKKGSWYLAIEPTDDFKALVDAGEITGVSLEGSGVRVPLEKAASFAEVIGARELRDALWQATSTLEDVIYTALRDEDESDPKGIIRRSLDEFVEFLAPKLDAVTGDGRAALAKELGTLHPKTTEEAPMGLADDFNALKKTTEETLEGIKSDVKKSNDATTAAVTGLVDLTGKLVERVEALSAGGGKEADKKDEPADLKKVVATVGKLADKLDEFDGELTGIAKSIRDLAAGDSADDTADDAAPVRKSKSSTDPLAGLLS